MVQWFWDSGCTQGELKPESEVANQTSSDDSNVYRSGEHYSAEVTIARAYHLNTRVGMIAGRNEI